MTSKDLRLTDKALKGQYAHDKTLPKVKILLTPVSAMESSVLHLFQKSSHRFCITDEALYLFF